MKKSLSGSSQRSSKGPVRMPGLSGQGDTSQRTSAQSGFNRKSAIPVAKGRSSSADRLSRNAVDLSVKKNRRSRSVASSRVSAATPKCGQSTRNMQNPSLSGSSYRCRSAERNRFANIATSAKRADSRPISEKWFQHAAMDRVYNYFSSQPDDIAKLWPTPNSKSIMIKTFIDMMQFLLQQFFPETKVNNFNYLTEIPILMGKLGYPGNLKTWLKTVNVPHAWPHVVAILSWLTDLLIYQECSLEDDMDKYFPTEQDSIVNKKEFFHYVRKSFEPWNQQNEAKCKELDNEFIATLRSHNVTKEQDEALRAEIAALEKQLEGNREADERAVAEEKALEEELMQLQKKHRYLEASTKEKKSLTVALEREIEDSKWKLQSYDKEKKSLMERRNELDLQIASQDITVAQAEEIRAECQRIEAQCADREQYNQSIVKMTYTAELRMTTLQKELNNICVAYNSKVLADFSDHKELILETDYYKKSLKDQWKEVDKCLERLIKEQTQELKRLQRDKKARARNVEEQENKKRVLWEDRELLKKERAEAQRRMDALKEEFRVEEETLKKRYEEVKSKTAQIVENMPDIEDIEAAEKKLVFEQERTERLRKEVIFIQEQGTEYIKLMVQIMHDREKAMMEKVADVLKKR